MGARHLYGSAYLEAPALAAERGAVCVNV